MTVRPTIVRRARPDDAPALAEIHLRARRAATDIPAMIHSEAETREWIAETVLVTQETWLAQVGEQPVGLLVLDGDELDQLYVDPGHQGQGHGAALLALAQARRGELALWTFVANASARRFYERHRFAAEGEVSSDNEEATPAVRYHWRRRR